MASLSILPSNHVYRFPVGSSAYVVDDDSEIRRSLHFLLGTVGITVRPFGCASDFIDELDMLAPAPVLLDFRMPTIDGLDVLELLAQRGIDWPVIVITAFGDVPLAVRSLKLGAFDFLQKPFALEDVLPMLQSALDKVAHDRCQNLKREAARAMFDRLTRREGEIVDGLMQGLSNKLIAHKLDLSTRTVEMHRAHALAKLEVKSIAEVMSLSAFVQQQGRAAGLVVPEI